MPCGPDADAVAAAVRKWIDAGFTHFALVQVGADEQDSFIGWAERELLPAVRKL